MLEERPKFDWGQRVVAAVDLVNDGSFPGEPDGTLLVGRGQPGEVVQVGRHVEANLGVSDGRGLDPALLARLKAHRWDRTPTAWSQ